MELRISLLLLALAIGSTPAPAFGEATGSASGHDLVHLQYEACSVRDGDRLEVAGAFVVKEGEGAHEER